MIKPTIHINGSSAQSLADEYQQAASYLRTCLDVLPSPNARDYYPQEPDAFTKAQQEHASRRLRVATVLEEVETLARHCADRIRQPDENADAAFIANAISDARAAEEASKMEGGFPKLVRTIWDELTPEQRASIRANW
jgi:hypothetical protein